MEYIKKWFGKSSKGLLTILMIIFLSAAVVYASSFSDSSESDFNQGTYSNTAWDTDHVELSSGQTSGTYTSRVFDSGSSATEWSNISWTSTNMEEIDNDQQDDVLLLHMNEASGDIIE